MTAELVRGQNHPLPDTRLELRVSAGHPVVAGATLGDEQGRVAGAEWIAHPGAPVRPGIEVTGDVAAEHRIAVDLAALPDTVHRLSLLLALPPGAGGPVRFGTAAAPFVSVTGPEGAAVATYTITGLDRESAVVALELYRRQGVWKVRAVGQGYEGGLADLLADQGAPAAADLAAAVLDAAGPAVPAPPVAPPPTAPEAAPAGVPADASADASATTAISYAHPGRRPAPGAGCVVLRHPEGSAEALTMFAALLF
ncbi:TerD family protein, partial [Streptomyces filamentosus]|uniref:TerD family protein n=1 Tax=Streptomyces filamentosus TaxID=67294 RepID=UPI0033288A01